jgi:DNA-binding transcriptional ArsR family regulator
MTAVDMLDATFRALADPTRRAMVARLARGDATVSELAEPFDVSLPAISKHLRVLEAAGLLRRERQGRAHRCRLRPEPLAGAAEWIAHYRAFWEARFDALGRHLARAAREEDPAWPTRPSPPRPRSASPGRSRRPVRRSSGRGPTRRP